MDAIVAWFEPVQVFTGQMYSYCFHILVPASLFNPVFSGPSAFYATNLVCPGTMYTLSNPLPSSSFYSH